ncbi:hypothetical protein ACFYS8_32005 [Kitasatospora sp. NPDC004615]|uniref:hypothetical protein n=1 Tax=Kitasatospora sp. NPDC004615 TaxID=3364017 RepID=UPI00369448C1
MPNGLVVGCESCYVRYAPKEAAACCSRAARSTRRPGASPSAASSPGSGRTGSASRCACCSPRRSCCSPCTRHCPCCSPPLSVLLAAVTVAALGYATGLIFQDGLTQLTPDELGGHAFGLHGSGLLAVRGVGAALAGAVAERTSPATAIAVLAAASLTVTLPLAPGLRSGTAAAA